MKTKTKVLEVETHDSSTGKVKRAANGQVFAKFRLDGIGWASCFNQNIIETLKRLNDNPTVNHEVVLDVEQKGKYKNIINIYPDGEQEEENEYTDAVRRVNEQEAGTPTSVETRAYVGYAKDIMCAYIDKLLVTDLPSMDFSLTMAQCCDVINKAKEVFSK